MTTKTSITLDESMMTTNTSKAKIWTSRIMSGLVILFMLADSIFKFIQPAEVVQGTIDLGYATHHIAIIGTLACLSLSSRATQDNNLLRRSSRNQSPPHASIPR